MVSRQIHTPSSTLYHAALAVPSRRNHSIRHHLDPRDLQRQNLARIRRWHRRWRSWRGHSRSRGSSRHWSSTKLLVKPCGSLRRVLCKVAKVSLERIAAGAEEVCQIAVRLSAVVKRGAELITLAGEDLAAMCQ